ncbi:MAG: hypothetical protein L6R36_004014 [Xanthoria steineri]|nr:MAG: hypothetical protein L6R36_004014 [Xanthoria steineri]
MAVVAKGVGGPVNPAGQKVPSAQNPAGRHSDLPARQSAHRFLEDCSKIEIVWRPSRSVSHSDNTAERESDGANASKRSGRLSSI